MIRETTTEQIKALRDLTGISVMQCKKALEEAKGDVEKALIILRKKGAEIAAKKSDRTFGAGAVASTFSGKAASGGWRYCPRRPISFQGTKLFVLWPMTSPCTWPRLRLNF